MLSEHDISLKDIAIKDASVHSGCIRLEIY